MTREETFVRLLNLGIQVAEIEAALADPKAAIDRYEAAVLFLREYDAGLPTLDAAARPPTEPTRSEGRTRMECLKCHQWSTYGTSCIGPCVGSRWKGVGRKDPAHDWQNVPWPEDDMPPLGVVEDRTTAQLVADGDWRPKVGERVIATRKPERDALLMLWALDARAACSGTSGVVRESDDIAGPLFYVEHANGDFAWWAADELRPEECPAPSQRRPIPPVGLWPFAKSWSASTCVPSRASACPGRSQISATKWSAAPTETA